MGAVDHPICTFPLASCCRLLSGFTRIGAGSMHSPGSAQSCSSGCQLQHIARRPRMTLGVSLLRLLAKPRIILVKGACTGCTIGGWDTEGPGGAEKGETKWRGLYLPPQASHGLLTEETPNTDALLNQCHRKQLPPVSPAAGIQASLLC